MLNPGPDFLLKWSSTHMKCRATVYSFEFLYQSLKVDSYTMRDVVLDSAEYYLVYYNKEYIIYTHYNYHSIWIKLHRYTYLYIVK